MLNRDLFLANPLTFSHLEPRNLAEGSPFARGPSSFLG
ncbi:hypothetical protein TERTU_0457 [Teredinibacter turnerae T7901]|uniref:Uncharacterized protein n=1 Tax=Teredinibacter turnerae (strain ATCC 39867 / T7901) TaxID=377629 RepID=C5BMW8_TERTT|nr:hypothetical protein TERTU_0457 [Teredinibacter turnerae T7901]